LCKPWVPWMPMRLLRQLPEMVPKLFTLHNKDMLFNREGVNKTISVGIGNLGQI
jgi:hypothetical protein